MSQSHAIVAVQASSSLMFTFHHSVWFGGLTKDVTHMCNLPILSSSTLVSPKPIMVLVSLSINLLSYHLRTQACEYFIFLLVGSDGFRFRRWLALDQLMVWHQFFFFQTQQLHISPIGSFMSSSHSSQSLPCGTDWGQSIFKVGGGVFVSPQLWWVSLAFGQDPYTQMMRSLNIWHLTSSITMLPSHLCFPSDLLPSKPTHLWVPSSAHFHKLSHHPWVSWPQARYVVLLIVERRCGMRYKVRHWGSQEEQGCHRGTIEVPLTEIIT